LATKGYSRAQPVKERFGVFGLWQGRRVKAVEVAKELNNALNMMS
tara:strand:- start:14 stop:148 length:135 start_codon:yes stop_codon:yes gene_type:complete